MFEVLEWLWKLMLWVASIWPFILLMIALWSIKAMFKAREQATVETVSTVVPTPDGARKKVSVQLDQYKAEAVDALVNGWGMSRKSAAAALEANGWKGYPDWEAMVQHVLSHSGPI